MLTRLIIRMFAARLPLYGDDAEYLRQQLRRRNLFIMVGPDDPGNKIAGAALLAMSGKLDQYAVERKREEAWRN